MSSEQPGERNIQNQEDEKARRVDDGGDAGGADEFGELPADRRKEKQSEVPESRNAEQPVRRRVPPNPEHDGGSEARAAMEVPPSEAGNNQGSDIRGAGRNQEVRRRGESRPFRAPGRGAGGQQQHAGYGSQIPAMGGNHQAPGNNLSGQNYQRNQELRGRGGYGPVRAQRPRGQYQYSGRGSQLPMRGS